jgi:hypothetical protein
MRQLAAGVISGLMFLQRVHGKTGIEHVAGYGLDLFRRCGRASVARLIELPLDR